MFKKSLCLILALLMTLCLFGCGSGDVVQDLQDAAEIIDLVGDIAEEVAGDYENTRDDWNIPDDTAPDDYETPDEHSAVPDGLDVSEDGAYNTKDEVALYIYIYGHLPYNYLTKNEARELGWDGGSVEQYAPGCAIGGDRFGNYEGLLPEADGREYTECDIDTVGRSSRGAKRIVFSNDGLIYYTDDHYESFELLYGEV